MLRHPDGMLSVRSFVRSSRVLTSLPDLSVPERTRVGQHHCHTVLVRRLYYLCIIDRPAWLNNLGDTGSAEIIHVIPEREEPVGGADRRSCPCPRIVQRYLHCSVPLPEGSDTE